MYLFSKRIYIPVFCLLLFFCPSVGSVALAADRITPFEWQQLTNDKAFNYATEKEVVKPVEPPHDSWMIHLLRAIANFFDAARWLIWLLIIGIAIYVVYRIFADGGSFMFRKNKKMMNEGSPAGNDEENIASTNWETLLQQALANNDLRMAVRYRYMWLLQLLQRQELIQYRTDKTNYEYYTELSGNYKQPFKQLSRQYEYVWYGHFTLPAPAYQQYSDLFNNLRKQLGA